MDTATADGHIRAVLAEAVGNGEVRDLVRLTGGASRETWRCEVDGVAHVVQRQRTGAVHDMAIEAAILRAAASEGVPVPPLVAHVVDAGGVSSLVTRFIPGETIARKILRDDRFAVARDRLAADLGRALARVHRIRPDSVPGLALIDPLETYRQRLDELGQPHPAFELAYRWLEEHRPPTTGDTVVVHGDYRLGNVIVADRGLAAVIDWELAHLGDPVEDLGWLCVPAWRFGSPRPVAGVADRDVLLRAYADESGVEIDRETLRWSEVNGILRWGIMCIMQAESHRSGLARSHELAAIGRRVCENEHDLFLALQGRW
ncbi:MAG TPA: phosphotransferase family protein [Ilumatobacter sp.]|nr:phosphotransferase family protein [Ilumatobacter sp.]